MTFDQKIFLAMAVCFLVILGGSFAVVKTLADNSHEIAAGAGNLAHTFMESAKGSTK